MFLVPFEDCRSLRDCTEVQRVWLKPWSVPALPAAWAMPCERLLQAQWGAVMVHQCCPEQSCIAPCSEPPAFLQTRQCWALPSGEISSPEVFSSWGKVAGITVCLQKPPGPLRASAVHRGRRGERELSVQCYWNSFQATRFAFSLLLAKL